MIYENHCNFIVITVRKGSTNKKRTLKNLTDLDMDFTLLRIKIPSIITQEFSSKKLKNNLGSIPVK